MKIIKSFFLCTLIFGFTLTFVIGIGYVHFDEHFIGIVGSLCPMLWLSIFLGYALFFGDFWIILVSILIAAIPIIGCMMMRVNTWIYRLCVYVPLCITFLLNGNVLYLNATVVVYFVIAILADLCNEK